MCFLLTGAITQELRRSVQDWAPDANNRIPLLREILHRRGLGQGKLFHMMIMIMTMTDPL